MASPPGPQAVPSWAILPSGAPLPKPKQGGPQSDMLPGKNQTTKELADIARHLASLAYYSNDYASQEKAALHTFQSEAQKNGADRVLAVCMYVCMNFCMYVCRCIYMCVYM